MEAMSLKDWTIYFVKNKDLLNKKLQSYKEDGSIINFKFLDKEHRYLIKEDLDVSITNFISFKGFKTIVCKGTKTNLKYLIDNWSSLKLIEDLTFIFVDISKNLRWIISPIVHARVCDEESLIMGLNSMFSNVFP